MKARVPVFVKNALKAPVVVFSFPEVKKKVKQKIKAYIFEVNIRVFREVVVGVAGVVTGGSAPAVTVLVLAAVCNHARLRRRNVTGCMTDGLRQSLWRGAVLHLP